MPRTLTKPDEIHQRLGDAWDSNYYNHLYRCSQFAVGYPPTNFLAYGSPSSNPGAWPHFPDIYPYQQVIGRSLGVLNTAMIALARNMANDPVPQLIGIEKQVATLIQEFVKVRAKGTGLNDAEWSTHHARTYMDGDLLGIGFTQIGARTLPDGSQYVSARNVPSQLVVRDRNVRTFGESRYLAFIHYLAPEDAVACFGEDILQYEQTYTQYTGNQLEQVRIFEYWDTGYGSGEPSMCYIAGDITDPAQTEEKGYKVLIPTTMESKEGVMPNPYGRLPAAHFELFGMPGLRFPIGRVYKTMNTQEAINQIEARMQADIKGGGAQTLYDPNQIDEQDALKLLQGMSNLNIKINNNLPGIPALERIQATAMDGKLIDWLKICQEVFNADTATSDVDRSSFSGTRRTATENTLVAERTDQAGDWEKNQVAHYYRRFYELVLCVAEVADTSPVIVSIDNVAVKVNEADSFSIGELLSEKPYTVLLTPDDLTVTDKIADQQLKQAQLQTLIPFVQLGTIDPQKLSDEFVNNAGFEPSELAPVKPMLPPGMPDPAGMPPGGGMMPQGAPA